MKLDHLFSTPVFTFHVKDADSLNVALINDIQALRATSQGLQRSNQKGWHSENDFFKREEPSFKKLAVALMTGVKAATQKLAPDYGLDNVDMLVEGWINVNSTGAFNVPHDHPGYVWSGCYYVQVPPTPIGSSGVLEFLDPRTNIAVSGLSNTAAFSNKVQRKPKAGLFYIFPSYLMHWVYPNEEQDERISIAFNVRFVRKGSQG